jgi:hypothetical protein
VPGGLSLIVSSDDAAGHEVAAGSAKECRPVLAWGVGCGNSVRLVVRGRAFIRSFTERWLDFGPAGAKRASPKRASRRALRASAVLIPVILTPWYFDPVHPHLPRNSKSLSRELI